MRKIILIAALFAAAVFSIEARGQHEPLLDILADELKYSFERLSEADSPPYYISFRVTDTRRRTASASFGVLTGAADTRERVFKPQIRIGSPEFDNFRDAGGRRSPGSGALLPLDDDTPEALRQAIWQQVESNYRAAGAELERLRADEHTSVARDDRAPDWSPAPVETYYEAPFTAAQDTFDADEARRRVRAYSAVFRDSPELLSGTASIDYTVGRRYLISTEGTSVVHNSRACRLMISATVRTDDGMDMPLYNSWFAFTPEGLPSDDEVLAATRRLAATLTAMASAPIVTPYTGPALLSGEAAGVFFHEIFGHRIEGRRMKNDADAATFKKMVGESVLPRGFSVSDDPTLSNLDGADLYGHYLFDDEGVRARRADVVRDGVLREFLMTRTPTDEFGASNGHARAEGSLDPVSRQSNLVVTTSRPLTDKQLRAALVKEARAQGREFGLFFKEVTGGFTQTGRYSPNSFNVTPLEVYKIYVDGRPDELVRGVDLIGTPLSMFANIMAAGGETEIFTGVCGAESGAIPVTAVSPTLLVGKVEVQRKAKSQDTPPILPRPDYADNSRTRGEDIADAAHPNDDVIFEAMQAELDRSMARLRSNDTGAGTPLRTAYLYSDVRAMAVSATLGETVSSRIQPQRFAGVRMLTGDSITTSDLAYNGAYTLRNAAIETDLGHIRREFWLASDAAYKQAAADLVRKIAIRRQSSRTAEEENLPDFLPVAPTDTRVEGPGFEFDRAAAERRTAELSAIFADYPSLYDSRVRMTAYDGVARTLTSEGVRTRGPVAFASIAVSASVRTSDGREFSDGAELYATSDRTLPTEDEQVEFVHKFARELSELAGAPRFEGFYSGPVLFTGEAVFRMMDDNLLSNDGEGLLVKRRSESGYDVPSPGRLENRIGLRVLDRRLSVVNLSSRSTHNGVPLLGRYEIDADGVVPPDSSVLVRDGMLEATLGGSIPTLRHRASTGSNRFSVNINPYIAPGTLEISATGTESRAELERRLLALAAADGLTHAYIVERMDGSGGGVNIVWRVDATTGERTPVSDADIRRPDLARLKRIAGVSSDVEMRNYLAGQVPASMIYPSAMLLEDIEIGATETSGEKPSPLLNPLER